MTGMRETATPNTLPRRDWLRQERGAVLVGMLNPLDANNNRRMAAAGISALKAV